jgi:hypothetical protein
MGKMKNAYTILAEKSKGKFHLGYSGVDGRILLKTNLKVIGLELDS